VLIESSIDIGIIASLSLELDKSITVHLASSDIEYWELIHRGLRPDVTLTTVIPTDRKLVDLADVRDSSLHVTIPFIVLTTNSSAEETRAYYEAGAIGIILKPFNPLTLASEIRRMLENKY
jgi:DNA-binding NtrC family response regulator